MLETTHKRFDRFTKKQVDKVLKARRLQAALAHPTDKQLKKMIVKRLRTSDSPPAPSPTVLTTRQTVPQPTTQQAADLRPADDTIRKGIMGKWVGESKNFCFIKMDDGKEDVFCHVSAIMGDVPKEGESVEFKIKHILKHGKPKERADQVKRATPLVALAY